MELQCMKCKHRWKGELTGEAQCPICSAPAIKPEENGMKEKVWKKYLRTLKGKG